MVTLIYLALAFMMSNSLASADFTVQDNRTKHRQGYRLTIFKEAISERKFLCVICLLVLRAPIQSFCGHRFCKNCFEGYLSTQPRPVKCPACLKEEPDNHDVHILDQNKIFPDNATLREMGNFTVICPSEGCNWTGNFRNYSQSHEDRCPYRTVPCPKCGSDIKPSAEENHLTKECPMRSIQCRYCGEHFIAKDNKIHNGICMKFPIRCEFCKSLPRKIPRDKMPSHHESQCPKTHRACLFGCQDLVEVAKYELHMKENGLQHLDFLCERIQQLESVRQDQETQGQQERITNLITQLTMIQAKVEDLQNRLKDLEKKSHRGHGVLGQEPSASGGQIGKQITSQVAKIMDELKSSSVVMDTKIATFEGIVAVLNREIERCSTQMESYETQRRIDREGLEVCERKIKALERIIALKDVALAEQDLRLQSLELASYDGTLLWRINDFTKRRNDAISGRATSMYSPHFYTSRTGYKMCCRIYLNGDGMGKGTHISLFFVVMRGHYDALLQWPFRQKVTLMLLDQNNREHIIDAFRPDPTSSSFKRPTSEMNIASGCPLFMPLSLLQNSNPLYVNKDIAFIKVIVDCSDL